MGTQQLFFLQNIYIYNILIYIYICRHIVDVMPFGCVHQCVRACVCVCMCVCVCLCLCVYLFVCVFACVCTHVFVCVYVDVHLWVTVTVKAVAMAQSMEAERIEHI